MADPEPSARSLDRFRTAMKFSLWTWALYWPGGGILLLMGGLDPVSVAVTLLSFGSFVALIAFGALRTTSSRTMKEFLLERPMYLIAALAVLVLLAPIFAPSEDIGLRLFATTYLGGIVFAGVRLAQHLRSTDQSVFASRADQAFLVFGLVGLFALMVFIDAWLPLFRPEPLAGTPDTVALANWMNLLYPPLLMLGTRPFRERLRMPRRQPVDPTEPSPEPVHA